MGRYSDYWYTEPPTNGGLLAAQVEPEPDFMAQYEPEQPYFWERPAHPVTGRPMIENPDGTFSTERTITVQRDGQWFNIPTIIGGEPQDESTAERLFLEGKNDPVGGPFKTVDEAVEQAIARSKGLSGGGEPQNAGLLQVSEPQTEPGFLVGLRRGGLRAAQSITAMGGSLLQLEDWAKRSIFGDDSPEREQRLQERMTRYTGAVETLQEKIEDLPIHSTLTEAVRRGDEADNFLGSLKGFGKAFLESDDKTGFLLNQAGEQVPVMLGVIAGTKGMGALLPQAGKAAASARLAGGSAIGSVSATYGPNMAEGLARGLEYDDAEARALKRSLAQGLVDAATGAVVPLKIGPSQFINVPTQAVLQAAGGAGGEKLAAMSVGEEVGGGELAAEALLELLGLPGDFYAGVSDARRQKLSDKIRQATDQASTLKTPLAADPPQKQIELGQPEWQAPKALSAEALGKPLEVAADPAMDEGWQIGEEMIAEAEATRPIVPTQPTGIEPPAVSTRTEQARQSSVEAAKERLAALDRQIERYEQQERERTEAAGIEVTAPDVVAGEARLAEREPETIELATAVGPEPVTYTDSNGNVSTVTEELNRIEVRTVTPEGQPVFALSAERAGENAIRIKHMAAERPREGAGYPAYQAFVDAQLEQGVTVYSDFSLSSGAVGIYEKMGESGYNVLRNPAVEPSAGGGLRATDAARPWVFQVTPKPAPKAPAEVIPLRGKAQEAVPEREAAATDVTTGETVASVPVSPEPVVREEAVPEPAREEVAPEPVSEPPAVVPSPSGPVSGPRAAPLVSEPSPAQPVVLPASEPAGALSVEDYGKSSVIVKTEDIEGLRARLPQGVRGYAVMSEGKPVGLRFAAKHRETVGRVLQEPVSQKVPRGTYSLEVVEELASRIGWRRVESLHGQGLTVVETAADTKLPAEIRESAEFDENAVGVSYQGKTYLVAKNILDQGENPFDVLMHEGTHTWVSKSPDFQRILRSVASVAKNSKDPAVAKAVERATRLGYKPDTRQYNEEVLAYMVQFAPEHGIVKRLINSIKRHLSENFGVPSTFWEQNPDYLIDLVRSRVLKQADRPPSEVSGTTEGQPRMSQPDQTQTPEFKRWFGDSKVVDAEGRPLVVYHGTASDFSVFDPSKRGSATQALSATEGFFFTSRPHVASEFALLAARRSAMKGAQGPNVMPSFLKMENPLIIESSEFDAWNEFPSLIANAATAGRDGVIVTNMWDSPNPPAMVLDGEFVDVDHRSNFLSETLPGFLKGEVSRRAAQDELDEAVASFKELAAGDQDYQPEVETWEAIAEAWRSDPARVALVHPDASDIYVVFAPEQIKSATGNRGTFDPESADIRFSRPAPTFYSQLARAAEAKLPGSGTGASMKQALQAYARKGEVKQEELDWSGVVEWLDEQSGKVTKDQVLEYLRANEVRLEETVLGTGEETAYDVYRDEFADQPQIDFRISESGLAYADTPQGRYELRKDDEAWVLFLDGDKIHTLDLNVDQPLNVAMAEASDWIGPIEGVSLGEAKFGRWQLPGGENYKEWLLRLPPVRKLTAGRKERLPNGRWLVTSPGGTRESFGSEVEANSEMQRLGEIFQRESFVDTSDRFTAGHYPQPNVVVHMRTNERTDADGKRVLFVEEVQSDWHQIGRKSGYQPKARKPFEVFNPTTAEVVATFDTEQQAKDYVTERPRMALDYGRTGEGYARGEVPDAPFKRTWPLLGMKKLIRHAAEQGFDRIAWTTGEQQAERYDLSKQVDEITVTQRIGDGRPAGRSVGILLVNGDFIRLGVDENGIIDNARGARDLVEPEGKPLSDVIGKDLADRIMQTKGTARFSDEDLRVGGEGQIGFYDQILPREIGKYVKKWGARVGETTIITNPEYTQSDLQGAQLPGERFVDAGEGELVHSIDITPQMRDAALAGQPMFSRPAPPAIVRANPTRPDADAAEIVGELSSGYDPEGAVMPKLLRNSLLGFRHTFESASDKLRRISGMKPVADMIDQVFDREQRNTGRFNKIMAGPARNATDEDRAQFETWARHWDQKEIVDAQEVYETMSDSGKALVDAWKQAARMTGLENQRVGVEVFDPTIGKMRPLRRVRRYYPRRLQEWARNAIYDPINHPEDAARLKSLLIEKGLAKDEAEAQKYIRSHGPVPDKTSSDYFSAMEKARTEGFPPEVYDYSLDTALDYGTRWAERLAQIETLGQEGTEVGEVLDKVIREVQDPKLKRYLARVRSRVYNESPIDPFGRAISSLTMMATGFQLGNFRTAGQNFITGSGLNFVAYGKYAVKGVKGLGLNQDLVREAENIGVLQDDILKVQRDLGEGTGAILSKFTSTTMKYGGYSVTERQIRLHAYLSGKHLIRDFIKQVGKNPLSHRSKKLIAWVQRNNFDYERLLAENGEGEYTDQVLRYIVNLPQGSYRINMTPVLVDEPMGRFMFKYRKYGTQVERMKWLNHFEPFVKSIFGGEQIKVRDPVSGEMVPQRAYDFVAMLRLLALPPIYGYANKYVRWTMFGTLSALAGPDWDDIWEAIKDDERAKAVGLALQLAWESMIMSGILGNLQTPVQVGRDVAAKKSTFDLFNPAPIGVLRSTWDFISNMRDQGTITASDVDFWLNRTFSFYNALAGSAPVRKLTAAMDIDRGALETFRLERAEARKEVQRYAEEMDLPSKRSAPRGGFRPTPQTPVNRKVSDAIKLGRPEQARAILQAHLNTLETEGQIRAAISSAKTHARNQQPIVIGAQFVAAERRDFLAWAKKNLSEQKYQRIVSLDQAYRDAGEKAGLLAEESKSEARKADRARKKSGEPISDSKRRRLYRDLLPD